MLMKYILVYDRIMAMSDGTCLTKTVGPFDTIGDANAWHSKNTPDLEASVDVICSPDVVKG